MHEGRAPGHFFSYYTSLKFTESDSRSHYSSVRRSLQHWVSGYTKQCGWLRLSALVQSLSCRLAGPLSFNDNLSIIFFSLFFHFGMKTLIYQTQVAGVVGRGSGWKKCDVFHFFLPIPLFSHRVM